MSLPTYQCHKRVQAAKIKAVYPVGVIMGAVIPQLLVVLPDGSEHHITVTAHFLQKHKPEAGGYFVVYGDDYQSFSSAKAFEEGYTLANDGVAPRVTTVHETALEFIRDLADEAHAHSRVGSGDEIALRHIARRAREALD